MTMRKLATIVGVLALVAAISVVAAIPTFAQTDTPPTETTPALPKLHFWGRGFGFGGGSAATFDEVAKVLGLTPTQLFEELHSGKTLDAIAEEKGVDLQKVQDALKASRIQSMKDNIAQAVKDGKMTQEQADWLLQGLEKGYMPMGKGGRGFGFGHGMRGGMRGFGGCGQAPAPNTPAPGTSS